MAHKKKFKYMPMNNIYDLKSNCDVHNRRAHIKDLIKTENNRSCRTVFNFEKID